LARRPYGRAELLQRLVQRGHDATAARHAVRRLLDAGLLDDEQFALDFILSRSQRGHAPRRAMDELRARGVDPETVSRARERARVEHGLDARGLLEEQARRRMGRAAGRPDLRQVRRVYNALLRAGFEAADVRSELEPYLGSLADNDLLEIRGPYETGPEHDSE